MWEAVRLFSLCYSAIEQEHNKCHLRSHWEFSPQPPVQGSSSRAWHWPYSTRNANWVGKKSLLSTERTSVPLCSSVDPFSCLTDIILCCLDCRFVFLSLSSIPTPQLWHLKLNIFKVCRHSHDVHEVSENRVTIKLKELISVKETTQENFIGESSAYTTIV